MLVKGDKVKLDLNQLANFPQWWREQETSNTGVVTEDESNGWTTVNWDHPRWYDVGVQDARTQYVEIASLLIKIEEVENADIRS